MRRFRWAAWLAAVLPIAVLFGPVLVTDRSFAMRDAAHFYYPLFEWCCREWAAGRVPLWNPLENCGVPVLADVTSSVFYPGKLIFLLPVDFTLRYKLYVIGHVVLAAAGSYWLARAWKASALAAAIAAIGFSCGGGVVFQYSNVVFLVGAAWLPFAAWAADRMLRERTWRAAILLGVVLALMILGGDPQAAYHALLATCLYAALLAFRSGGFPEREGEAPAEPSSQEQPRLSKSFPLPHRPGGTSPSRLAQQELRPPQIPLFGPPLRALVGSVALTAFAAAVGFLLAAVQVLPSSEATKYSERAAFDQPRNVYEVVQTAAAPPPGESLAHAAAKGIFGLPEKGSHHDLAYDFSVGPWRLAEYVWPNISGRMFPTNRRWMALLPAEGRTWTPTLYLGLLPLLLGLSCFRLRSGDARQRWLSWLVLIFTLGSFGAYGAGWLVREACGWLPGGDPARVAVAPGVGGVYWLMVTLLPAYVYFRYPAKLLPLVALGLSQLAAAGWDRTFAEPRPKLARVLRVLGVVSAAAAFIVWFIGPAPFARLARVDASLGPFDGGGAYRDVLMAFLQTAGVAVAARWLLGKAWSEPARAHRWQSAALALCAVELAAANAWLVATAPAVLWREEPTVAAAIRHAAEGGNADSVALPPRVLRGGVRGSLAGWRPASFAKVGSSDRPAELVQWERDTLFPKYHLPSGISLVESYGSIKLMDYESLLFVAKQHGSAQPENSVLPHSTALRLTATELLLLPAGQQPKFADRSPHAPPEEANRSPHAPREEPISRSEMPTVWKMKRTQPRAWIVPDVEVLPPLPRPLRVAAVDKRTKAVLFPGGQPRDFSRWAVVETDQPRAEWSQQPREAPNDERQSCRITYYDPQRVVVQAELARPGLIVVSEAWFPGWKAVVTTDGEAREVPIYRTNRVLRGVWLPSGEQTVEFRYEPASFYRGAAISAASWLVLAGLLIGPAVVRAIRSVGRVRPAGPPPAKSADGDDQADDNAQQANNRQDAGQDAGQAEHSHAQAAQRGTE